MCATAVTPRWALGVGHDHNTSLHVAEHRATYPGRRTKIEGAPLIVDGTRQWVTYVDLDHDAADFLELAKAFVASGGDERRVRVGIGEVATCRMREIVDFGIEWISNNRSTSSGPTA